MCSTKSPSSLRSGPGIHGPARVRQVAVGRDDLAGAVGVIDRDARDESRAPTPAGPGPGRPVRDDADRVRRAPASELPRDVGRLVVLLVGIRERRAVRDAHAVDAQVVLLAGRHVRDGAHDRARAEVTLGAREGEVLARFGIDARAPDPTRVPVPVTQAYAETGGAGERSVAPGSIPGSYRPEIFAPRRQPQTRSCRRTTAVPTPTRPLVHTTCRSRGSIVGCVATTIS